jgi:hypothetical protein
MMPGMNPTSMSSRMWKRYCGRGATGKHQVGCSKRLSSKAIAREEARRTLQYVEPLSKARTKLADVFSILPTERETVYGA